MPLWQVAGEREQRSGFLHVPGETAMLKIKEWMQDRADPYARERSFGFARLDPPPGVCADAAAAVREVLESIGDSYPE